MANAKVPRLASPLLLRVVSWIGSVLIVLGSAAALFGAWLPWGQLKVLGAVPVALPAVIFSAGLAAVGAAIAALVLRRWPLACLILSLVVIHGALSARTEVPMAIKKHLIAVQISLFPVNRLLDQFHINDIEAGNYGARDETFLGSGIRWTLDGGLVLLLGALLALPGDPLVTAAYRRLARRRCGSCGAAWPPEREVAFCPQCGAPAVSRVCSQCGALPAKGDRYCVRCGTAVETTNH